MSVPKSSIDCPPIQSVIKYVRFEQTESRVKITDSFGPMLDPASGTPIPVRQQPQLLTRDQLKPSHRHLVMVPPTTTTTFEPQSNPFQLATTTPHYNCWNVSSSTSSESSILQMHRHTPPHVHHHPPSIQDLYHYRSQWNHSPIMDSQPQPQQTLFGYTDPYPTPSTMVSCCGQSASLDSSQSANSSDRINHRNRKSGNSRKIPTSCKEMERKRDLANQQERRRMHRLNDALIRLRQTIPNSPANSQRRMSKIKTLQSAISYIRGLQELLKQEKQQQQEDE